MDVEPGAAKSSRCSSSLADESPVCTKLMCGSSPYPAARLEDAAVEICRRMPICMSYRTEAAVHVRFLITGTLLGGIVLSLLSWVTAAILPPRYKQFKDARVVVETIRANVSENDIYTAPQGVFVSISNPLRDIGSHIAKQFGIEFIVALGLSLILGATRINTSSGAAGLLGLIGL